MAQSDAEIGGARHSDAEAPLRGALDAIEQVLLLVDKLRATLEQACEIALCAADAQTPAARAALAEQYNQILDRAQANLAQHVVAGASAGAPGPEQAWTARLKKIVHPAKAKRFAREPEISQALRELDRALAALDAFAEAGCREAQFISVRYSLTP